MLPALNGENTHNWLTSAGVEKIFYFLGPKENIENCLQIIK